MSTRDFVVYIYKSEVEFLENHVKQRENIETGGDLFGAWIDDRSLVIQVVSGPGKGCRRSVASFFQDINYLENVGEYLTTFEGICNVGEWHSHHRLGLPSPSYGDQTTVWQNIPKVGLTRFVLFIANIACNSVSLVNVGCFLFDKLSNRMITGRFEYLQGTSPMRSKPSIKEVVGRGAEPLQQRGKEGKKSGKQSHKRNEDEETQKKKRIKGSQSRENKNDGELVNTKRDTAGPNVNDQITNMETTSSNHGDLETGENSVEKSDVGGGAPGGNAPLSDDKVNQRGDSAGLGEEQPGGSDGNVENRSKEQVPQDQQETAGVHNQPRQSNEAENRSGKTKDESPVDERATQTLTGSAKNSSGLEIKNEVEKKATSFENNVANTGEGLVEKTSVVNKDGETRGDHVGNDHERSEISEQTRNANNDVVPPAENSEIPSPIDDEMEADSSENNTQVEATENTEKECKVSSGSENNPRKRTCKQGRRKSKTKPKPKK